MLSRALLRRPARCCRPWSRRCTRIRSAAATMSSAAIARPRTKRAPFATVKPGLDHGIHEQACQGDRNTGTGVGAAACARERAAADREGRRGSDHNSGMIPAVGYRFWRVDPDDAWTRGRLQSPVAETLWPPLDRLDAEWQTRPGLRPARAGLHRHDEERASPEPAGRCRIYAYHDILPATPAL